MEQDEVQRLLLAAQVRELASKLRNGAAPRFSEDDPDANTRWKSEHKVTEFVPQAMQLLRDTLAAME